MRTTSYWKFGTGYSYRTPGSKKTRWVAKLSDVPKTAKTRATGATKKKARKSSPKKEPKRRRKTTGKKKTKKRSGFRLPGGLGPKGILFGALGMAIVPRILPVQSPGAQKLAAGMALRALKIGGGGPLAAVGLMELAAQFAAPALGGIVGGFGFGAPGAGNGGYMY